MNKEANPLIDQIIYLYDNGYDANDIYDHYDGLVKMEEIEAVVSWLIDQDFEASYDHDDAYDHDSAMGSVGWGTDEDYGYFEEGF